jgi:hypothetical protein
MGLGTCAMKATLVLSGALADELEAAAVHPLETAGVLLASVIDTPDGRLRILGRCIEWVSH